MTKREYFEEMKSVMANANRADLVEFCDKQIELLSNRTESSAEKAKKEANMGIKAIILDVLKASDKPMSISEMQYANDTLASLTNQKINSMLIQLGENGTKEIVRTVEKKVPKFAPNPNRG